MGADLIVVGRQRRQRFFGLFMARRREAMGHLTGGCREGKDALGDRCKESVIYVSAGRVR